MPVALTAITHSKMVFCKVLVLVIFSVTLTFIQAHPFDGMMLMNIDEPGEEKNEGWMMDGKKENKDEQMKIMELFMKCLQFLKEKQGETEKARKLHELFKYFVKSMEDLKEFHQMIGTLDKQRSEGNVDERLKRFFGREDDGDRVNDDNQEEKMKKLFFVFMKFKAVLKEMKETEKDVQHEKLKKQFLVFVKFVKFAKESKARLEMLGELSKIIELKFKAKFMTFKKCMQEGRCVMDDDEDEGKGKGEDEGKFHQHIEMFVHMMKHLKDKQGQLDAIGDGYTGQGKVDDKSNGRFLELLMKLHKHVLEHAPEFWGDAGLSPEEKMKKFTFFAYSCYKHMQELKAMMEQKTQINELFYKFGQFLELHENGAKAKVKYMAYQKWQEAQRNKTKVEEMRTFLKKVAIFKRMVAEKREQEAKEESMNKFFEEKMKDFMERSKNDKEDFMKKFIDARMKEHLEKEKDDKEDMMKKFIQKMKEENEKREKENKMKAMLQLIEHTDL